MSKERALKKPKIEDNDHEGTTTEMADQEEDEGATTSPDMFADCYDECDLRPGDFVIQIDNDADNCGDSRTSLADDDETVLEWKGTSLHNVMEGCHLPQLPDIKPSENHQVLFRVPYQEGVCPDPHPLVHGGEDRWDGNHVRMPHSPHNLYVVQKPDGSHETRCRWDVINSAFSGPLTSSHDLAAAILSYNTKYTRRWDFQALHYFFLEELSDAERTVLINDHLPFIIALAISLPKEITAPVPLLRTGCSRSLSLSQRQTAVLLANAFLCTFPRRNALGSRNEFPSLPDINFCRLFSGNGRTRPERKQVEKIKCVFQYFARVKQKVPQGVLTFSRVHVPKSRLPRWDRLKSTFGDLHVTCRGTIEDDAHGMLQADFANSLVGGGVLGSGCVQEEIRFLVCPEMILARLFTEKLGATEALIMAGKPPAFQVKEDKHSCFNGCERFSAYSGYANSFEWVGDFRDESRRDASGRIRCIVVAIDALFLRNPDMQFSPKCMLREINKVFVGCSNPGVDNRLCPFATGNWGCGAFGGDPKLKALLQLMGAAGAERGVVYFTFGDVRLRDELHALHAFLVEQRVTIARLWEILVAFHGTFTDGSSSCELYPFIYSMVINKTEVNDLTGNRSTSTASRRASSHSPAREAPLAPSVRGIIPQMDDATREARLANIENAGKRPESEAESETVVELAAESKQNVQPVKKKITDYFVCSQGLP